MRGGRRDQFLQNDQLRLPSSARVGRAAAAGQERVDAVRGPDAGSSLGGEVLGEEPFERCDVQIYAFGCGTGADAGQPGFMPKQGM